MLVTTKTGSVTSRVAKMPSVCRAEAIFGAESIAGTVSSAISSVTPVVLGF